MARTRSRRQPAPVPGAPVPPPLRRPRPRRTWPQRLVIGANVAAILGSLGTAAGLQYAYGKVGQVERIVIDDEVLAPPPVVDGTTTTVEGQEKPLPPAENFLVVGVDNRSCISPDSPWAGAFLTGPGGSGGSQLTDTIMLLRVDPALERASIVSFPRDLYVPLAGTTQKSKINAAYAGGADRLIKTISDNFGIPVHHFLEVDFCAFRNVVDAIGGVSVPFETAVRDRNTGLGVVIPIEPGCHTMSGDEALAYSRSRHYEYREPGSTRWRQDPTADLGRIRRQQDLVRRLLQKAIDKGARNPATLNRLVDAAISNVRIDDELTPRDIVDLGEAMSAFDPEQIDSYTIEADPRTIGGQSVLVPRNGSLYNLALALIFQGQALPAPADTGGTDTTAPGSPTTTTMPASVAPGSTVAGSGVTGSTTAGSGSTGSTVGGSSTSAPMATVVVPTTQSFSLTPTDDLTCR